MALVDTNILVYAYDPRDVQKSRRAVEVIRQLELNKRGVLSTQILNEFFNTVTRNIPNPIDPSNARVTVQRFIKYWDIVPVTTDVVLEGMRGAVEYQLQFWDSLIWAAAKLNDVDTILSEDFSHGQVIEGVQVVNPFISEVPP